MKKCVDCHYSDFDGDQYPCVACDEHSNRWVAKNLGVFTADAEQRRIDVAFPKGIGVQSAGGVKYDNGKPQWSLLPFKALTQVVEVLTYGAKKYAPDNWKKVPNAKQRYTDAGFRHFAAYASGETHDSETGKHHLAHAICCLLYIVAFDLGEHND
jgi:hypothetical protein